MSTKVSLQNMYTQGQHVISHLNYLDQVDLLSCYGYSFITILGYKSNAIYSDGETGLQLSHSNA